MSGLLTLQEFAQRYDINYKTLRSQLYKLKQNNRAEYDKYVVEKPIKQVRVEYANRKDSEMEEKRKLAALYYCVKEYMDSTIETNASILTRITGEQYSGSPKNKVAYARYYDFKQFFGSFKFNNGPKRRYWIEKFEAFIAKEGLDTSEYL